MLKTEKNEQKQTTTSRKIREWLSKSSGWFYQVQKTLYRGKTAFQEIEIVETDEFGTTFLLDGATQVMEKNEFQYHEPIAHLALLAHPQPEKVLIIGGGDGCTLREVLKHPSIHHIDFVELDAEVIEFSRTYLKSLNCGSFDDPRVHVIIGDGRSFLEQTEQYYDVIIMDMIDPTGPAVLLYTKEFFETVYARLKDSNAIFVMHSESPEARPQAFSCIHRTLKTVFPVVRPAYSFIQMYGTLWSFVLCSSDLDPATLDAARVQQRIIEQNLQDLRMVTPESWPAFFVQYPYIEQLLQQEGPIITDTQTEFPDKLSGNIKRH